MMKRKKNSPSPDQTVRPPQGWTGAVQGLICFILLGFCLSLQCFCAEPKPIGNKIILPSPSYSSEFSVEQAIYNRKSVRMYKDGPLTLQEISQLLWAALGKTVDGLTGPTRAYPSAGGIYPLEIYLVAGKVDGIISGFYRYDWAEHSLTLLKEGDFRSELMSASLNQRMIGQAAASIVFTARASDTISRYGSRGEQYLFMDVGGAGQNIHLQAEALGLGTVIIGAFNDASIKEVLNIQERPLYIMPVGRK